MSERNLKATDPTGWQRTSPFAAVFYLSRIVRALAKNVLQSIAPLAAFMVAFEGDPLGKLAIGASAVVIGIVAVSLLRYWFFRYRITGHSILIRDGILNKKQLDIGFDRIQAVNTRQNIVFRWLGLVTLTFDSAGSSAEEGYLPAVPVDIAESLRDRIQTVPMSPATSGEKEAGEQGTLLRLAAGDIVLAGLSSGRVFLLLAVLGPLGEAADRELEQWVEETAVLKSFAPDAGTGLLLVLGFVAAVLLVLLAGSVFAAFLRYHGFTLTAGDEILRSIGGLLTRHEHSVSRQKVQSVTVIQNAVLRLSMRFRLRIRQAAAGRSGSSRDFLVPICRLSQLDIIGREIFREEAGELPFDPGRRRFERISPGYMRSRILMFGLIPAVIGAAILLAALGPIGLSALLWMPLWSLVVWQVYRRYGYAFLPDGVALRSGFIGHRVVLWLHRKAQRVTIRRSPFQRRRNLASLHIHLAGGAVCIPFIPMQTALALADYVLLRVESSESGWH